MKKKKKINRKNFFKFNKSRWIIFIIIFLILPIPLVYPSSNCSLFSQSGMLQAICYIWLPCFLTIPFSIIESNMGHVINSYFISTLPIFLLFNIIISFILSYPLNLFYKKIRRKE